MPPTLLVMIGGAIGAALRFHLARATAAIFGAGFPWGTLIANLAGSLAMGTLAGLIARGAAGEEARLLLGVGLLGGYTTFSAFSMETVALVDQGATGAALAYVAASVVGAIALCAGAFLAVRGPA